MTKIKLSNISYLNMKMVGSQMFVSLSVMSTQNALSLFGLIKGNFMVNGSKPRYFSKYRAWHTALRKLGVSLEDFTGDKDIDGVYLKDRNIHAEWDGAEGLIESWE